MIHRNDMYSRYRVEITMPIPTRIAVSIRRERRQFPPDRQTAPGYRPAPRRRLCRLHMYSQARPLESPR